MDELNVSKAAEAKSDRLNAVDLLRPRTIVITNVKLKGDDVIISYYRDEKKPYIPCVTMVRLIIKAWGDDALKWINHKLTLYNDEEVKYLGNKTGGIRISHMTGIEKTQDFDISIGRGRTQKFWVSPVADETKDTLTEDELITWTDKMNEAKNKDELEKIGLDINKANYNDKGRDKLLGYYKQVLKELG